MDYQNMTDEEREESRRQWQKGIDEERAAKAAKWAEIKAKLIKAMERLGLEIEAPEDNECVLGRRTRDSVCYLFASWDRWGSKGRVSVSVSANGPAREHLYSYNETRQSITFDGKKSPEQMCADISRRMLAHYDEVEARARARIQNESDYIAAKASVLTRCKGAPATLDEIARGEVHMKLNARYGTVKYYDAKHVSLELSEVPAATALKILALVRDNAPGNDAKEAI